MRIDQIVCDRCGFAKPNGSPHVQPAIIKIRGTGSIGPMAEATRAQIDLTADWCEPCYDGVLAAVRVAMAKP